MPEPEEAPQDNLSRGLERWADPLGEYERHPAAPRLPPFTDAAFEKFKRGVRDHGQQYDIEAVEGTGGKKWVVRGWHMLKACRLLGIEPRVGTPDRELRTDADVRLYVATETTGRDWNPALEALWTLEEVVPKFRERAAARKAGDAAALDDTERGQAVRLACRETHASGTYVKNLAKIAREAPELYAEVRARIYAGDPDMNVRRAMEMLRHGLGDDNVWRRPDPEQMAAMSGGERPRPVDPIPEDLWEDLDDVCRELGVATRSQAIEALLQFRWAEADAWERFLPQYREARER